MYFFLPLTRACVVTVILRHLVSLKDLRRRKREASIRNYAKVQEDTGGFINYVINHNYIKILESDWSTTGLISAVIVQLHTSCACNCTVVRVMPE